jgi:hypothetical protein
MADQLAEGIDLPGHAVVVGVSFLDLVVEGVVFAARFAVELLGADDVAAQVVADGGGFVE